MLRSLTIAAFIPLLVLPGPAHAVTAEQFDRVEVGWSRHHVQDVFDDTGIRVTMWAGPSGRRHLIKSYPAADGGRYVVTYVGRPKRDHPLAGPYHVQSKAAEAPSTLTLEEVS